MSDALGIHLSKESKNGSNHKEIWESTTSTFVTKLFFASTFIIPVLFFSLKIAIAISIIWGLSLIFVFSFYLAKQNKSKPAEIIFEHLFITIIVIILTYSVGLIVNKIFG